jgi:uncharacterized membrane protein YcjF (UPF0283 family)
MAFWDYQLVITGDQLLLGLAVLVFLGVNAYSVLWINQNPGKAIWYTFLATAALVVLVAGVVVLFPDFLKVTGAAVAGLAGR